MNQKQLNSKVMGFLRVVRGAVDDVYTLFFPRSLRVDVYVDDVSKFSACGSNRFWGNAFPVGSER